VSLRRSKITYAMDIFFLYPLIFINTFIIIYFLWINTHWLLAILLMYPIYRVIGNLIIDLTTPLYNLLTPENKAWSKYCKAIYKFDLETTEILEDAIEKWDNGGDCKSLRESCKQIKLKKSK
jgi:hypothetical protein